MLIIVGQFTGIMIINDWFILGAGIVFGVIAYILMKRAMRNFTYESLLSR